MKSKLVLIISLIAILGFTPKEDLTASFTVTLVDGSYSLLIKNMTDEQVCNALWSIEDYKCKESDKYLNRFID